MRVSRLVMVVVALALTAQPLAVGRQLQPGPCTFPAAEIGWLQGALDQWERVARRSLRIDPSPLPFTGSAAYAELESLFLTMESVGQWAAYQVARSRTGGSDADALRLVRDDRKY